MFGSDPRPIVPPTPRGCGRPGQRGSNDGSTAEQRSVGVWETRVIFLIVTLFILFIINMLIVAPLLFVCVCVLTVVGLITTPSGSHL